MSNENVNQRMLAALKNGLAWIESNTFGGSDALALMVDMRSAIAAAEAAQPDHIVDADKMVHAVPDELNCDDIERLRIALSWEGYSTPEGLEQCAARWPELVRDLIRAVLSRKKRAQQPASSQPVAVPDGWKSDLWRYGFKPQGFGLMENGPYVLLGQVEMMLSAAQKPESEK